MQLNLKNPLIFFDLETTGIDIVKDRIVEISYIKVYPNGKEKSDTIRVNPTIPISPKATAIHGITDEDIKDAPTFTMIAKSLQQEFEGCDFAGYNSNKFDIPMLAEEFIRADIELDLKKRKIIDVQIIFYKMEQRTLEAAYKFYCHKKLINAHSSHADTKATYEVLQAQLDQYVGQTYTDNQGNSHTIENDMDFLSKFSSHTRNADFAGRIIYNDKDEEIFNFGKYKGQKVTEILKKDPAYYGWMMNNDFPEYTKKVLTNIKLRELTQKE